MDIITSAGYQYQINKGLLGRVEVIVEDLEGIRNSEEAEGGAKMLVGPSVNYQPAATPFNFTLSGGPALYLAKNKPAAKPKAGRELEKDVQNGYTLRINVNYSF